MQNYSPHPYPQEQKLKTNDRYLSRASLKQKAQNFRKQAKLSQQKANRLWQKKTAQFEITLEPDQTSQLKKAIKLDYASDLDLLFRDTESERGPEFKKLCSDIWERDFHSFFI